MQKESRKLKRASDVEVNLRAPGQRFKTEGKTLQVSMGKVKGMKYKKDKVCDVCHLPWLTSIRVIYGKDGRRCVHDLASGITSEGAKAERRINGRLAPGEVAVKGGDGLVRIYG